MSNPYSRTTDNIERQEVLVEPYGGALVQAYCAGPEGQNLLRRINSLPRLDLTEREFLDLELLGSGAFSPLDGFMNRETYIAVRDHNRLPSGLAWGWPVTLAVSEEQLQRFSTGCEVALFYRDLPIAMMEVSDIYYWDAREEAIAVFGTENIEVKSISERISANKTHLLGGAVQLIVESAESGWNEDHLWPVVTRNFFEQQNWQRISALYGMQVWHRGHEYVLRNVLYTSDALLLQPLTSDSSSSVGLPEDIAQEAQESLVRNFFSRTRILINRLSRRFDCKSSRAILQQAIISQNYGCDRIFFIPPTDTNRGAADQQEVRRLFGEALQTGLKIKPEYLDATFYCQSCDTIATEKSCPHDSSHHLTMIEADLVEMLYRGDALPPQTVRPEIARALSRTMSHHVDPARMKRSAHLFPHASEVSRGTREMVAGHRAAVLWMTGLSGSGKSTIAHRLERELLISGHRVFVLDGDSLRTGLCADLGFSREARQENLRRAGEVAKVLREAGMLVIASFISPFRSERETLVNIIGDDFYEVYVDASIETCESRDPKGLYKRARAGVIPEFTGISSPYEPPENPAIHLRTDNASVEESVNALMHTMSQKGLLRAGGNDRLISARPPVPLNRNQRMQ